jgi:hypothetical protein
MHKEVDSDAAESPLIALHRKACLDAARDMIVHIHRSFELAPGLRRWSYYCFYCLQATLVLLPQSADDRDAADYLFCIRAVEVFEQIKLKASQRCADVVRQYLQKRAKARQKQKQGIPIPHENDAVHNLRPLEPVSALQRPEPATAISYAIPEQNQPCDNITNGIQDCGMNSASLPNIDDGVASWPSVSPTTFQTEMYGALYSIDPNDNFHLGHQPYFYGTGGYLNDPLTDHNNDWSHLWTS